MRVVGYAAALGCALALVAIPSASLAAEPPNPNDPCSTAGRDTCGTTGVGFYQTYRYGIRWFGDYRGAVPGPAHTFCIDLGYWYPSPSYQFRQTTRPLRNRLNEPVPVVKQQRMAFAIWRYGRSTNPNQQAAVMLYVHSLMGDARPGEIDPAALNPSVAALFDQIQQNAIRLSGPYRVEIKLPAALVGGKPATGTVRVLSSTGNVVPFVQVAVTGTGASGLQSPVDTGTGGVALVRFTPSAPTVNLTARTEPIASTLPSVYAPTTAAAARNSQRIVVPDSQTVSGEISAPVGKTRITLSSRAVPSTIVIGQASRDVITIKGALASWQGEVAVRLYGPFQSEDAIRCTGTPIFKTSFRAKGSGIYAAPPAMLDKVGWYGYVDEVAGDALHIGAVGPCRAEGESFRIDTQPKVRTIVSETRVQPGTAIHDRVLVSGLADQHVTVSAFLYGPFASPKEIVCTGQPVWTGTVDVPNDGEFVTADYTVTKPGYYTYREAIAAGGFVRAAETACGEVAETTVATGTPQVKTLVSAQQTRPGATISDRVTVTGLGVLTAPVAVTLWGPFTQQSGIHCSGTPYWTGSFVAKGDGTYTTPPVKVDRAGYYTYHETIAAGPATSAFTAPCAETAETTFVHAVPAVTTAVSDQVVFPGAAVSDRINVTGLGKTPAAIDVELFGPFASRAAISCSGQPYWRGRVYAQGDGQLHSPAVHVKKVGFYTFRERLAETHLVAEATTECALAAETSLARPEIITGRGDHPRYVAGSSAANTPTRVRLPSVRIDAPVSPSLIDIKQGVLGVPPHISRTGWWQDGAAPGSTSGAVLIAGHVDRAGVGPGAFFRLKDSRPGQLVHVRTADGRTYTYRVTSVRFYLKAKLPTNIYSTTGAPRLVLVTCGGPFIESAGHYRDNVVLTAVPA